MKWLTSRAREKRQTVSQSESRESDWKWDTVRNGKDWVKGYWPVRISQARLPVVGCTPRLVFVWSQHALDEAASLLGYHLAPACNRSWSQHGWTQRGPRITQRHLRRLQLEKHTANPGWRPPFSPISCLIFYLRDLTTIKQPSSFCGQWIQ